jgi:hypothetical protein
VDWRPLRQFARRTGAADVAVRGITFGSSSPTLIREVGALAEEIALGSPGSLS